MVVERDSSVVVEAAKGATVGKLAKRLVLSLEVVKVTLQLGRSIEWWMASGLQGLVALGSIISIIIVFDAAEIYLFTYIYS